jgi:hypothetical protein
LNVQRVSDTAEPLVPEPSLFAIKIVIAKLKIYKSSDIEQIAAELIQARSKTLGFEICNEVNSMWNK